MNEEIKINGLSVFNEYHKNGELLQNRELLNKVKIKRNQRLENYFLYILHYLEKRYNASAKGDSDKIKFAADCLLHRKRTLLIEKFQKDNSVTTKYLLEHFDEILERQKNIKKEYDKISPEDNLLYLIANDSRAIPFETKTNLEGLINGLELYKIYLKRYRYIK